MKALLYFVCGIVLADIIAATFIWPPSRNASSEPAPIVNEATLRGQDPWMANEKYNAPNRDRIRQSTLETLDQPWSSFCTSEGHALLLRSIDYYYGQRDAQAWSYAHTYGEAARRYVNSMWTTPDDSRIERLMGETYGRGYFSLGELRSSVRAALAPQVEGVRVRGKPCVN